MKRFCWALTLLMIINSGCHANVATPSPTPQEALTPSPLTGACKPVLPHQPHMSDTAPYSTLVEPFNLQAPSGNRIYGLISRPDPAMYPGSCFAAVVMVPGGINPGRMEIYGYEAKLLSEVGMVVVAFNAEGRGSEVPDDIRSEGEEDYNGYRHQDGLCSVVAYTMDLPYVIAENMGLRTKSYGITMGAGCASRHPELPIKYIVDNEGPSESFVTCHEPFALDDDPANDKHELVKDLLGHYSSYRDASAENQAFWEQREAIRFIGGFRGRYLRLQATWDHAQPPQNERQVEAFTQPPLWWPHKHTTDMVNAAIAGGVPWVQVNFSEQGNQVNATYDVEYPPTPLPGTQADGLWGVRAVIEMARMP